MGIRIYALPILVAILLAGCGPRTYEDCVLENLKNQHGSNASEDVVSAVMMVCRKKFPSPKIDKRELSSEELKKLQGVSSRLYKSGNKNYIEVTLYNGNQSVTVADVVLRITEVINGKPVENTYNLDMYIAPKSARTESVQILGGDISGSWGIAAAKGWDK